jgi:hypothetical protein
VEFWLESIVEATPLTFALNKAICSRGSSLRAAAAAPVKINLDLVEQAAA